MLSSNFSYGLGWNCFSSCDPLPKLNQYLRLLDSELRWNSGFTESLD